MSARSLSFSTLVASVLLAATASADRLLVGGPGGVVFQADTADGQFEYFACQCGGPIQAMTSDKLRLFTADTLGSILVYDVATGVLENGFSAPDGPATALAAGDGFLFAGSANGLVARMNPLTGDVLDVRAIPVAVRELLAHRGFLFAAGADGAVYRAPLAGGDFTYFTCFCFFNIESLTVEGEQLVIADQFGTVGIANLATGELLNAFWVGSSLNSMVVQDGDLLVHSAGGVIDRLQLTDGTPLPGGFTSPIDISSMLVIRDNSDLPPLRARFESPK